MARAASGHTMSFSLHQRDAHTLDFVFAPCNSNVLSGCIEHEPLLSLSVNSTQISEGFVLRLKSETGILVGQYLNQPTPALPRNDSDSVTELEDDEAGVTGACFPPEMNLEERKRVLADLYDQGYVQRATFIARAHDIDLDECIQRTRVRSPNSYNPTPRPVFDTAAWLFTSDRVYLSPSGLHANPGNHAMFTKPPSVKLEDVGTSPNLDLTAATLAQIPNGSPSVNRLWRSVDTALPAITEHETSRTFYPESIVAPSQSDEIEFIPDVPKNKRRAGDID
ncbi:hypothetical protein V5O48_011695 [Marasmius crinis-equi]|uniref:UBA domain-containing protein n=1 Tax=Marasmius crinis-equi TaxID=585013 RepID=A0ABR3F5D7_9AGAR